MEETDSTELMTNLILSDFKDPSIVSEFQVNSEENDCVLPETNDIASTYQRQGSNINMDEERKDRINDMKKREKDESLPVDVLNVPDNTDCTLGKGKEKVVCCYRCVYDESLVKRS